MRIRSKPTRAKAAISTSWPRFSMRRRVTSWLTGLSSATKTRSRGRGRADSGRRALEPARLEGGGEGADEFGAGDRLVQERVDHVVSVGCGWV